MTTDRAIRFAPALSILVAMPAYYSAAKVTASELRDDTNVNPARAELAPMAAASAAAWANCIAPADHDEDAATEAQQASADAWADALAACDRGDLADARAHLETARTLAAEWGDDSEERKALELLD